jgi:hypothetical protein
MLPACKNVTLLRPTSKTVTSCLWTQPLLGICTGNQFGTITSGLKMCTPGTVLVFIERNRFFNPLQQSGAHEIYSKFSTAELNSTVYYSNPWQVVKYKPQIL